nr:MAG TPA: CREB-binding protein [Caudoviricetes sp.]
MWAFGPTITFFYRKILNPLSNNHLLKSIKQQ